MTAVWLVAAVVWLLVACALAILVGRFISRGT